MRIPGLVCAAALAFGCDGEKEYSGATDVTGVGATPFVAVEANAIMATNACAGGGGRSLLRLALVDKAGFCGRAAAGQTVAGMGGFSFVLAITTSSGGAPGFPVGSYSIPTYSGLRTNDSLYAGAGVIRLDSTCSIAVDQEAMTGQVTILSSSVNGVGGNVDATAPDGTHVAGTFSAVACNVASGDLCTTFTLPDITTCLP